MENQHEEQNQLNIELNEEIAEGQYANLAIITHSNAEFVVDFVNVMPGLPKAKVKSRIILTPQHAKRFMKAMLDNIKKYESVHGPDPGPGAGVSTIEFRWSHRSGLTPLTDGAYFFLSSFERIHQGSIYPHGLQPGTCSPGQRSAGIGRSERY
ncbi:DUF3467 domain-containing protein [Chitinophaga sp. OAE865]|uniref:DUF3467 domain-containing protein n=1 Tax=Chitinophaga sp. OAE865 TaxID=2817898 RepID=UPI0033924EAA